ncbi:hypothetical protein D3C84_1050640 [compost metagenome]
MLDLYQGEIPGGLRCHEEVRILAASTIEALSPYIGLICDFLYGIPKRHVEHKWIFAEESLPFGFTGIVIHHLPISLDELTKCDQLDFCLEAVQGARLGFRQRWDTLLRKLCYLLLIFRRKLRGGRT